MCSLHDPCAGHGDVITIDADHWSIVPGVTASTSCPYARQMIDIVASPLVSDPQPMAPPTDPPPPVLRAYRAVQSGVELCIVEPRPLYDHPRQIAGGHRELAQFCGSDPETGEARSRPTWTMRLRSSVNG